MGTERQEQIAEHLEAFQEFMWNAMQPLINRETMKDADLISDKLSEEFTKRLEALQNQEREACAKIADEPDLVGGRSLDALSAEQLRLSALTAREIAAEIRGRV